MVLNATNLGAFRSLLIYFSTLKPSNQILGHKQDCICATRDMPNIECWRDAFS